MLREGSVPKSSYPCRWPLLIIVAVDFLNFLCVTEVLARSLLAMPAAARKMDVSVVIWECLFDAKAKN